MWINQQAYRLTLGDFTLWSISFNYDDQYLQNCWKRICPQILQTIMKSGCYHWFTFCLHIFKRIYIKSPFRMLLKNSTTTFAFNMIFPLLQLHKFMRILVCESFLVSLKCICACAWYIGTAFSKLHKLCDTKRGRFIPHAFENWFEFCSMFSYKNSNEWPTK